MKQLFAARLRLQAALLLTACFGVMHAQSPEPAASTLPIRPMTQVNEAAHLGYFGDPYPIHPAPHLAPDTAQYFSGTTQELLTCQRPIRPGCFSSAPLTVAIPVELKTAAQQAGSAFYDKINDNVYQADDGEWQMAVTLYLHKVSDTKVHWTVIAHAHPQDAGSATPPTAWIVDTILVGSIATSDYANYDGKYFEDDGKLYLIYSKRLISKPVAHDGIVAQLMTAPAAVDATDPVVLLAPSTEDGGFNSEYFHTVPAPGDSFKLIETGNITKIADKYVMAYSAGDYQQRDYKTGLAFSDTFLPAPGHSYRRILQEDVNGVWGNPGHNEVVYLLQSQKPGWNNYVGSQVIAPGVPSIVHEAGGRYLLYFDGFLPTDAPCAPKSPKNPLNIDPKHRRPFFLPLRVRVPSEPDVDSVTDEELKSWITAQ
jgi:hypothetical protein